MALSADDLEAVCGGAAGENVLSRSFFQSDSGTGLNIRADWSVVSGPACTKTPELGVSALSYRLQSNALHNSVELSVNGAVYLADSSAVRYGGKDQIFSELASTSIPYFSGAVSLVVVCRFNGSYSGVALPELRAAATINV